MTALDNVLPGGDVTYTLNTPEDLENLKKKPFVRSPFFPRFSAPARSAKSCALPSSLLVTSHRPSGHVSEVHGHVPQARRSRLTGPGSRLTGARSRLAHVLSCLTDPRSRLTDSQSRLTDQLVTSHRREVT
eukprot:3550437-Rhodomonas_salina.1